MRVDRLTHLLALLGHPDRLRLLLDLLEEPRTQKELSRRLDIPQPSVSKHLYALARDGVIEQQGSARTAWRVRLPDEVQQVLLAAQALVVETTRRDSEEASQLAAAIGGR